MNPVELKYKSFFYSLSVHLLLAVALFSVYQKSQESHEVYSRVDLNSIQLCAPSMQMHVEQKQPKTTALKSVQAQKSVEKKKTVKKITPVHKPATEKKVIAKAPVQPVEKTVQKPEPVIEKVSEEKPEEVVEVEEVKMMTAMQSVSQEEQMAPVMSVSEPKLSYEAQYMEDNLALINALIKKNLAYPRLAKKRGLQGKTMVSFTLNIDGKIVDIEAIGETASILKKSAIKTIRKASHDFPHPKEMLALSIPIVYKLN